MTRNFPWTFLRVVRSLRWFLDNQIVCSSSDLYFHGILLIDLRHLFRYFFRRVRVVWHLIGDAYMMMGPIIFLYLNDALVLWLSFDNLSSNGYSAHIAHDDATLHFFCCRCESQNLVSSATDSFFLAVHKVNTILCVAWIPDCIEVNSIISTLPLAELGTGLLAIFCLAGRKSIDADCPFEMQIPHWSPEHKIVWRIICVATNSYANFKRCRRNSIVICNLWCYRWILR